MCEEIRLTVVCISILLLSVTKIYPVDLFDILLPRMYETHKFKIKYNDISVSFAKVTGLLSKLFLLTALVESILRGHDLNIGLQP